MGIVHHSNYPIWFEAGRTEYIKSLGLSYSQIEEMGLLLPVTELKCNYKSSARYEDTVVVRTSVKSMSVVRISFYYEIFIKGDPDLIASGETLHAWTDKDLKPVNLKKFNTEIYELLKGSEN